MFSLEKQFIGVHTKEIPNKERNKLDVLDVRPPFVIGHKGEMTTVLFINSFVTLSSQWKI